MLRYFLIGGGIANFTDVAATFTGLIKAIRDFQEELREHRVEIWVRSSGKFARVATAVDRRVPRMGRRREACDIEVSSRVPTHTNYPRNGRFSAPGTAQSGFQKPATGKRKTWHRHGCIRAPDLMVRQLALARRCAVAA